jgi:hypothetical protein
MVQRKDHGLSRTLPRTIEVGIRVEDLEIDPTTAILGDQRIFGCCFRKALIS